jgi:hypothetical protein
VAAARQRDVGPSVINITSTHDSPPPRCPPPPLSAAAVVRRRHCPPPPPPHMMLVFSRFFPKKAPFEDTTDCVVLAVR